MIILLELVLKTNIGNVLWRRCCIVDMATTK